MKQKKALSITKIMIPTFLLLLLAFACVPSFLLHVNLSGSFSSVVILCICYVVGLKYLNQYGKLCLAVGQYITLTFPGITGKFSYNAAIFLFIFSGGSLLAHGDHKITSRILHKCISVMRKP